MTFSARAFRKLLDAILYRTVTNRLAADGQTEGRRLHIRRCYSGESAIAKKGYSSAISVRPSERNTAALSARISVQFRIGEFYGNLSRKSKFGLNWEKKCRVFDTKT